MVAWWPLLTGTLTATFAGVGVTLLVMDRLQRITAEFDFEHRPIPSAISPSLPDPENDPADRTLVKVTVSNKTKRQIEIIGMEVGGLPLQHIDTYPPELVKKTRNGYRRSADIYIKIDAKADVSFMVQINWRELSLSASQGMVRPTLRASVIIDCKTWIYPIRSFKAQRSVPAEIIEKNAAKEHQK